MCCVTFRDHPVNVSWTAREKVDLLRLMVRMRRFDYMALNRYCCPGEMGGWLLLSVGQETVAACARSLLGPMDHTITGFRGMGHAIAAGMYMRSCMAELMGLIENNGYAMGTSVARSSAFRDCLAQRAEGYGIEWDQFSDADPYEMRARIAVALDRARIDRRPSVLEIETYRYYGFTIADANHKKYRSPQEIEARGARDPLNLWQDKLIAEGLLDEDAAAAAIHEEAKTEALAAVATAKQGTPPTFSEITSEVYWESDHGTVASATGRHFFD